MEGTRIPKARPHVLTGLANRRLSRTFASASNMNRPVKQVDTLRRPLSRRSKTATELRAPYKPLATAILSTNPTKSTNKRPQLSSRQPLLPVSSSSASTSTGSATTTTGTIKRKAPLPKDVPNAKEKKIVPAKTALPAKPAPYDYKARFHILNEKHTKLRSDFTDVSDKYKQLNESVEDLLLDREVLKSKKIECVEKDQIITDIQSELEVSKREHEEAEHSLKITQKQLTCVSDELEKLKGEVKMLRNINQKMEKENTELLVRNKEQSEVLIDLQERLIHADYERRRLHNTIQDLKGNIRVFCRVRPVLSTEIGRPVVEINYQDESTMHLCNGANLSAQSAITGSQRFNKQEFSFDRVFSDASTQEQIFEELGQLVESALDGYNVCVFAYGQTGSGKTYTMEGSHSIESLGMIPRTVNLIFESIKSRVVLGWTFEVRASFLEIYNEHILDLLNDQKTTLNHEIRMVDAKSSEVFVTNQKIEVIHSGNELIYLLQKAQQNRAVAATVMNACSSRSHSVTKIQLVGFNKNNNEKCSGSLNLVDLAGSERARDSEFVRLTETKNINKSLANLSNVILALTQKQEHIPYRNSKLTHLLMPSLGGNSKTLMIVNISPLTDCYNESLNSLRFASKVNSCKTGTVRRNKTTLSHS